MDLAVTTEQRMYRTPDGVVWAPLLGGFWRRYRHAFARVRVVARVFDAPRADPGWEPLEREGVTLTPLPAFDGLIRLVATRHAFHARVDPLATDDTAVLLRIPSVFAGRIGRVLARAGKPFGAEVVGDPGQVLAPGAARHPLRIVLRRLAIADQRWLCRNACATAYVTEVTLQRHYPPGPSRYTTHYSDIDLGPDDFVSAGRAGARAQPASLVHVGTFSQPYKGQHLLVQAVDTLRRKGIDLRLTFVGDGRHRAEVEAVVRDRGLDRSVEFSGEIAGRAELRAKLDASDLFVLPSLTEGLPRVLIEAMARALPCIAAGVGGVPELLPPEAIFPPGDGTALAAKIAEVLADPGRMARMSAANLARSLDYAREALRPRGERFQARLRDETAGWIARRARS